MPYKTIVLKVMIASPSDIVEERKIARKVIHNWNDLHSEEKKIVLLPIGWETHSHPESGNHPQEIINKQILKNSDLLIGIFWTRLGTPTKKADSGTVEEIEEHIKAGKPTMLYFSNKQINPRNVDNKQYEMVKAFKEKYKDQSLYHEFDTTVDFERKLYEHLVLTINTNEYFVTENTDFELKVSNSLSSEEEDFSLSEEARKLLIEASKSSDGRIIKFRTRGGLTIQTNNKGFVSERSARLEAVWEDALNQLIENDLIEDKGYKGEVFAVTRLGYKYADKLKA